jgi:hypothetical protein
MERTYRGGLADPTRRRFAHRLARRSLSRSVLLAALLALALPMAGAETAANSPQLPALAWEARSDWQSAKAAGALGDGLADDSAPIQKLLDAAQDGTTIYLPPGTYRLTKTLTLIGPRHGVLLVGHGRDTTLVWDGEAGGKMLLDDGVAYSRFVGIQFDGRNRAAIGFFHHSERRFETEVRHQHLAFRNFTEAGVLADPKDAFALAETLFENCLFENCRRGVSFTQFNDYDFTFDGCEFRACEIAVECVHGNFYVRNCRFEGSRDVDILSAPEHGSSVRRCVSVGSQQFIRFSQPVGTMTIEGCRISDWRSPDGAISLSGAPVVLFDCLFTAGPAGSAPVRLLRGEQRLITSQNAAPGAPGLFQPGHSARLIEIPAGQRQGVAPDPERHFLKSTVAVPGRVFDARRDFGAKGDGTTDDTAALQQAIAAAKAHGQGAIAYLPTGTYVIRDTLRLSGGGYTVGGSGWNTRLVWRGAEGGTMVAVEAPQGLTLEHLNVGSHDAGAMNNAIDILQTGANGPSHLTYDGVYVYGMYQKQPFRKGLHFDNLGPQEVVSMPHVQGNLHLTDCAQATILGGCTYEGSIVVDGKDPRRTGLLGFLTRLATLCTHGLYLRDNQSIVMSDFYVEQADNGFVFEGEAGLPPGRATIQGAKLHFTVAKDEPTKGTAMDIRNYAGQVFFGHSQFYIEPTEVRLRHSGTAPFDLYLLANCFYSTRPAIQADPSAHVWRLGNEAVGTIAGDAIAAGAFDATDTLPPAQWSVLSAALDDLRRLGEADLRLNHGRGQ